MRLYLLEILKVVITGIDTGACVGGSCHAILGRAVDNGVCVGGSCQVMLGCVVGRLSNGLKNGVGSNTGISLLWTGSGVGGDV